MTEMDWEAIERNMRASIKRQLKAGRGHCQIHVRAVARHPWRIKERRAIQGFTHTVARPAYALAVKLLEEYGGKICMWTYRNGQGNIKITMQRGFTNSKESEI